MTTDQNNVNQEALLSLPVSIQDLVHLAHSHGVRMYIEIDGVEVIDTRKRIPRIEHNSRSNHSFNPASVRLETSVIGDIVSFFGDPENIKVFFKEALPYFQAYLVAAASVKVAKVARRGAVEAAKINKEGVIEAARINAQAKEEERKVTKPATASIEFLRQRGADVRKKNQRIENMRRRAVRKIDAEVDGLPHEEKMIRAFEAFKGLNEKIFISSRHEARDLHFGIAVGPIVVPLASQDDIDTVLRVLEDQSAEMEESFDLEDMLQQAAKHAKRSG